MDFIYVTVEQAVYINSYLIERYSPKEQKGIKDYALLDSAINRPQWHYYATIHEKAAALLESLAKNHAFYNANKRTAINAVMYFYKKNGYGWSMSMEHGEEFVIDIVNNKYTPEQITAILNEYTRKL